MAVLLNTDQGALIDHALLLKRVYSNVEIDSKRSGSYLLKTKLFKIDRPFKMDSQVLAEQTAEGKGIPRRNRKVISLIHVFLLVIMMEDDLICTLLYATCSVVLFIIYILHYFVCKKLTNMYFFHCNWKGEIKMQRARHFRVLGYKPSALLIAL